MITLNVRTPIGREIHTNGHRGKSFYVAPCKINVFAGIVLLETIDAGGQVDYRIEVTAKEGHSPVDVDLQQVAQPPSPQPPRPAAKPASKPKTRGPKTKGRDK